MKRMGAIESDSVKLARKAKDKLYKACERASETHERTLHGQEQNNAHGKYERVTRQWSISSQHTSPITCTAAPRVWHFSAFHFIRRYIEHVMSCKRKNHFGSRCEGWGGVAGERSVGGVPKFHSWGKCTMPLTNINSDWMSNASPGLCINLCYIILYYEHNRTPRCSYRVSAAGLSLL